MDLHFGVGQWLFAVTDASAESSTFLGFSPSTIACAKSEDCFIKQDGPPKLSGMAFVSNGRVTYYDGSRPNIAQKNIAFQHSVTLNSLPGEVESALHAAGARFAPSSENEVRDRLQRSELFSKYGFQLHHLKFCRTAGTSDHPEMAMYWMAMASSSQSRRRFVLTMEPFEGDITSLIMLTKDNLASASCNR